MKFNSLICLIFIVCILIFATQGCKKDENINQTNGKTTAVFNPDKSYGTMTDQNGNVYKTIIIGSQTWMAENLRTTIYRNGDKIPEVTDSDMWFNLSFGAYCNYENSSSPDSIATYGRLYNWEAVVDDRNIAPSGWHVPTYEEWMILESFLGDSVAGDKLRETGTLHWKAPNYGATNETGFTALGGGYQMGYASGYGFHHKRIEGGWWTASEDSTNVDFAFHVTMGYNYPILGGCWCPKRDGYSIRCLKD
jgi:uncharacterized protein (TIGR02145 family)